MCPFRKEMPDDMAVFNRYNIKQAINKVNDFIFASNLIC